MVRPESTRRQVLALGTAGITSLSGCGSIYGPGGLYEPDVPRDDPAPPKNNTEPDGTPSQPPDEPAATIKNPGGNGAFEFNRLPRHHGWALYGDRQNSWDYRMHPNSRAVRADVTDSTITVTVPEMKLDRAITLTAHYTRSDGSVGTTDSITASPESDDYQTYEWTLPVNGDEFPRHTRAATKILAEDTHPSDDMKYELKEHYFAVIPYQSRTTSGEYYLSSDTLNHHVTTDANGSGSISYPEDMRSEYIDTDTERIRFFALTYPNNDQYDFITAYTVISHNGYDEYHRNRYNSNYRRNHNYATYMYNAEDFEYFTTLADSFTTSLDKNGITNHFDRLQYLAYLIGCFEYNTDDMDDPQLWALYNGHGDCSEMTMVYLALLNLDAFGPTRGAYIRGNIRGTNHAVIGIDERDIDPPDDNAIYWVEPSQDRIDEGVPDTRYAFLEATSPREIGEYDDALYTIYGVQDTNNLDAAPEYREF